MRPSRITLAVETGALPVPAAGEIAVFRGRPDHDFSALPAGRLHVIQGFRPFHDALAGRGLRCGTTPEGPYAAALVACTRSRVETLGLIAEALTRTRPGGHVAVDGQKTDGIDSIAKSCKRLFALADTLSKAHGKLLVLKRPETLPDMIGEWAAAAALRTGAGGVVTQPGVFSADGIDPGSALLAEALPQGLSGQVADLGAGWGALAPAVLAQAGVAGLDLVEAEHAALQAARANLSDPRVGFLWQDVATWRPEAPYDLVLSNPPFHQSRAADPALGQAFIRTAAAILKPGGRFLMVANRQLPYERTLTEVFGQVATIRETATFKVISAARPRATPPRGQRKNTVPSRREPESGA